MSDVGKKWREGHFGGAVKWLIIDTLNLPKLAVASPQYRSGTAKCKINSSTITRPF
jgi:hypothetical protein